MAALKWNKLTQMYEGKFFVIVSKSQGFEEEVHGQESWANTAIESGGQRVVEVNMEFPREFFDPLTCTIKVPEILTKKKPIEGEANQVNVPVTINGNKSIMNVTEDLTKEGNGNGVIALMKKKGTGAKKGK